MKKQNLKKDSHLPLNNDIAVNFRCYFNLVSTTHGACLLGCAQMKAQIFEPANWLWACTWRNQNLHTYFQSLIRI